MLHSHLLNVRAASFSGGRSSRRRCIGAGWALLPPLFILLLLLLLLRALVRLSRVLAGGVRRRLGGGLRAPATHRRRHARPAAHGRVSASDGVAAGVHVSEARAGGLERRWLGDVLAIAEGARELHWEGHLRKARRAPGQAQPSVVVVAVLLPPRAQDGKRAGRARRVVTRFERVGEKFRQGAGPVVAPHRRAQRGLAGHVARDGRGAPFQGLERAIAGAALGSGLCHARPSKANIAGLGRDVALAPHVPAPEEGLERRRAVDLAEEGLEVRSPEGGRIQTKLVRPARLVRHADVTRRADPPFLARAQARQRLDVLHPGFPLSDAGGVAAAQVIGLQQLPRGERRKHGDAVGGGRTTASLRPRAESRLRRREGEQQQRHHQHGPLQHLQPLSVSLSRPAPTRSLRTTG
mmetsp:Transcript_2739/g.6918  ORF Transcript_2739/g.6918 Transcript_2739/m.6918 type:complete len:408 (+) Transcript_2739:3465-4688(+)